MKTNILLILIAIIVFFATLLIVQDAELTSSIMFIILLILPTISILFPRILSLNLSYKFYIIELMVSLLWINIASIPEVIGVSYLFSLLILSKILLFYFTNRKAVSLLYYCFMAIFTIPFIINRLYFLIHKANISPIEYLAILQTNSSEALEYLCGIPAYIYSIVIIAIIFYVILIKATHQDISLHDNVKINFKKSLCLLSLLSVIIAIFVDFHLPNSYLSRPFLEAKQYYFSLNKQSEIRKHKLNTLVTSQKPVTKNQTILLVIGESANRDYMHAYNDSNINNTPWLTSQKHNFIFFDNAYSGATLTVPSLVNALTEANYYNKMNPQDAVTIIDIAKANGYKTYWFSNQARIGFYDTPITLIAEKSDVVKFTSDSKKFDENILPFLSLPKGNHKNFIIVHLYGSHKEYKKRYPENFQKWHSENKKERIADYNNSLAYTDYVLKNVFEQAMSRYNLEAFVYFSDHGSDPTYIVNSSDKEFVNSRIPLCIYLSPQYKKMHPETTINLENNKKKLFSNDLIYNLMCGLMHIESNFFNSKESLTFPQFIYNERTARTCYGEKLIAEDREHIKQ